MVNPRKKPKFLAQGAGILKRIKERWRRPRGLHSKMRKRKKGKRKMPSIGYRAPKELRGLHPSGFREVLVKSLKDLEKIDVKKDAIKISSKVGKKLREKIIQKAKEIGIKILNP